MGAIQNAINQGLTATGVLYSQSPGYEIKKAEKIKQADINKLEKQIDAGQQQRWALAGQQTEVALMEPEEIKQKAQEAGINTPVLDIEAARDTLSGAVYQSWENSQKQQKENYEKLGKLDPTNKKYLEYNFKRNYREMYMEKIKEANTQAQAEKEAKQQQKELAKQKRKEKKEAFLNQPLFLGSEQYGTVRDLKPEQQKAIEKQIKGGK